MTTTPPILGEVFLLTLDSGTNPKILCTQPQPARSAPHFLSRAFLFTADLVLTQNYYVLRDLTCTARLTTAIIISHHCMLIVDQFVRYYYAIIVITNLL